jgi:hypothetical protein
MHVFSRATHPFLSWPMRTYRLYWWLESTTRRQEIRALDLQMSNSYLPNFLLDVWIVDEFSGVSISISMFFEGRECVCEGDQHPGWCTCTVAVGGLPFYTISCECGKVSCQRIAGHLVGKEQALDKQLATNRKPRDGPHTNNSKPLQKATCTWCLCFRNTQHLSHHPSTSRHDLANIALVDKERGYCFPRTYS